MLLKKLADTVLVVLGPTAILFVVGLFIGGWPELPNAVLWVVWILQACALLWIWAIRPLLRRST